MVNHRERAARLATANQIIRIIGSYGRRFLSLNSDRREPLPESENRYSRFEMRNGRIWYIDKWREKAIFVHYEPRWRCGRWRGFSEGGTLQALVEALRDYIRDGKPINPGWFGPFPQWSCGGDPWGYGGEMAKVREEIEVLLNNGQQEARTAA